MKSPPTPAAAADVLASVIEFGRSLVSGSMERNEASSSRRDAGRCVTWLPSGAAWLFR